MRQPRDRRGLHPLAWWGWALALGAAALRTTNPLLLGLLVASAWLVVAACRPIAPWARSFGSFFRLGCAFIVVRMVLQAMFGTRLPGTVLVRLPEAALPDWAAGVSVGGPVTAEALVAAFRDGLQLAALLACVGAANSLASPYRLLRTMPTALYEMGVVVTVALSFAPQATVTARRVREARRLRGRPHTGLAGMRGLAVPVLEGALERSLQLAASMDSRGYGRRGPAPRGRHLLAQATLLGGAVAACVGGYGLLDASAPNGLGGLGLLVGIGLLATSLVVGGTANGRTRYRPDPWRAPEWITLAAGLAALAALMVAARVGVSDLRPDYSPLAWPTLPLLPAAGVLVAALPAVLQAQGPSRAKRASETMGTAAA